MKVDELIRQKAEELHQVHAHDSLRLDELEAWARPRRRPKVWVLIGAAVTILLLFGPVALFLRSEEPAGESTPAESSGEVSIGERLFEIPSDGGLGPVMASGSDLIVAGFDTVSRSSDGGDTWEVTGSSPPGDDSLIRTEAADGMLLAVGAHDGSSSRLYRSADYGATWEQFELPAPPETGGVVTGVIAHRADEWIISGVGADSTLYVWRSSDAVNWEFEEVIDLEGGFAYTDALEVVDDRLVIISRIAQDTALTLFALEETDDGWARTELTPILESQAGLPSEFVNAFPKKAGVVGGRLQAWWSFDDASGGQQLAATAYRTGLGEWQAEPLVGVAPETVTITPDGLVGTAHPGADAPMLTPGFTAIVVSNDGITWDEVGRIHGLYLRQLRQLDDRHLIAAGNETELTEEGLTVPSSGIWEVVLSDDIPNLLETR